MSSIGHLRMFVDPDARLGRKYTPWDETPRFHEFVQIGADDRVFMATGYCLHLALNIHESREGRRILTGVGKAVIRGWDRERVRHIYNDDLDHMGRWVDYFLASIRADFPNLYVTGTIPGEGMTRRLDARTRRLDEYRPKSASNMFINRWKVDIIIKAAVKHEQYLAERRTDAARQAGQNWDTAVWSLSKTIAHELVHVFVGYLMGGNREITPPTASHPGFRDGDDGESGRLWEGLLFQGIPAFVEDDDDRLGDFQAGVPYLTDIDGEDRCKKISQNWVANLARGVLEFPCALSSAPSLRSRDLFRDRDMAEVRKAALARTIPPALASQPFFMDRRRGRADASRADMDHVNGGPVFSFRPSRYPIPARV